MNETDWATTRDYEPCLPCRDMYGDDAPAEPVRDPSPQELAAEGVATLNRVLAIAAGLDSTR